LIVGGAGRNGNVLSSELPSHSDSTFDDRPNIDALSDSRNALPAQSADVVATLELIGHQHG
jgi:hypothetical protein